MPDNFATVVMCRLANALRDICTSVLCSQAAHAGSHKCSQADISWAVHESADMFDAVLWSLSSGWKNSNRQGFPNLADLGPQSTSLTGITVLTPTCASTKPAVILCSGKQGFAERLSNDMKVFFLASFACLHKTSFSCICAVCLCWP